MNKLQSDIKDFCTQHNMIIRPELRVLDLVSEVGELSKEILKGNNYGSKEFSQTSELESELGDVYFALLCLANELDIDAETALHRVLDKYKKRLEKGSAGSESE